MNWKLLTVLAGAMALAGCQAAPQQTARLPATTPQMQQPQQQQQAQMVWVRTDGQRGAGNPALLEQYQMDTSACPGSLQMSRGAQECMGQRGYILVPVTEAEETRRLFAAQRGQG